jgi:sugar lactone lactonase YvrE
MCLKSVRGGLICLVIILLVQSSNGASFYPVRPDDPEAVYLTAKDFPVIADGKGDDSDALQQAINKVEEKSRYGIVFIPEGRYRLGKTVFVWAGIRLIGYGSQRPVFVLGENTPGYQTGDEKYMIHFASNRPRNGIAIRDANPGTFYSAISNINFEIQDGNPAAIAIRSHFAQHCYLAHIDFRIGNGKAGVEKVGNEMDDCHFFGGDYGIITTKPSPSWPFLMIDTSFEGQRKAAVQTEEGGMTLIRNQFKNVPTAVLVNPDRAEELYLADSRFEDINGPAILISDENNARSQTNLVNVVCQRVPVLAAFRNSDKKIIAPGPIYHVKDFSHGLHIDDIGDIPEIKTTFELETLRTLPGPVASDIPGLPSMDTWANLKLSGAKGDGIADDTENLKTAIANHSTIYLPAGRYRITETITLKSNTVLVGFNPIATQIILSDKTPAFQGAEAPKAMLEAPKGGTNIISGIGIDTGGINNRAVAVKWMAGANSMMNDVRFLGGHGTYNPDGSRIQTYNDNRTGDGNPERKWDSQYWSIWVTDGGGGTFKDIWTPSPYAQGGIYISNTSTQGRIYAMSIEHHVRNEIKLNNVSNWKIHALQMEEESGESWHALPVEIQNCRNITFANLYLYRVIRMVNPFPYGVKINASQNIAFRGVHVYSPAKFSFDNTIYDETHDVEVRSREIARLTISGNPPKKQPVKESRVLADGAKVEKVKGGFEFIDGSTVDSLGNVYFTDSRWHRIYRWSPEKKSLTLIRDIPISPLGLAFDKSGNLLVTGRGERRSLTVYAFNPDGSEDNLQVLSPVPAAQRKGKTAIVPGHRWRDAHDFLDVATAVSEECYVSPDGTTFIPKCDDLLRAFTLRSAIQGQPFYLADEFGQKTWAFSVNSDGSLCEPKLFAGEGELDVVADSRGNVYVAAGSIFVYDRDGKQIDRIEVPERPASLVFGGKDRKTLFITARSSLYSVRTRYSGR